MRSGDNNGSRNKCKRSRIQNDLKDLLEVIFQVSNHGEVGRARSNKRSNDKCNNGSKSTCRGESWGATVATFGRGLASKLVFAVVKILARTTTS